MNLKRITGLLALVAGAAGLIPFANAQNVKSCCVGKLPKGSYHIACAQPAMGGMGILQNMRARDISCTPQDYAAIGKQLCNNKKAMDWTTNVLNVPTSCEDIR